MQGSVEKREVEELLGEEISKEMFQEALDHAKRKQEYIFRQDGRKVVLQHWYLVKLTEEYARSLAFSKFTMDLCQEIRNMEKEHLTHLCKDALRNNHIVTELAL